MGAVIDEGMQQRLEVCVVGTMDVGSRSQPPWRSRAAAIRNTRAAEHKEADEKPPGAAEAPVDATRSGDSAPDGAKRIHVSRGGEPGLVRQD